MHCCWNGVIFFVNLRDEVVVRRSVHILLTLAIALCCYGQQAAKPSAGSVSGILTDSVTGVPISRASITLTPIYPAVGTTDPPPPAAVSTQPDGTFVADDVKPGRYLLSAQKAGYLDGIFGARGDAKGTPITVHAGDAVTGVVFQLTPGIVISGTVQNEDGEPFPNVNVFALQYKYFAAGKRLVPVARTTTSDRGEYRLHDLTPGTYFVVCTSKQKRAIRDGQTTIAGRYPLTYYPSVTSFEKATKLVLGAGNETLANFTLTATRTYSIEGKISGADPGTHVTIEAANRTTVDDSALNVDMDNQQGFVIKNVPPGSYRLRAVGNVRRRPGRGTTYVTVEDNDVHDVLIELSPQAQPIDGYVNVTDDLRRSDVRIALVLQPAMGITEDDDDIMPPTHSGSGMVQMSRFEGLTAEHYAKKMFITVQASGPGAQDVYIDGVQQGFHQDVTDTGLDSAHGGPIFVNIRSDGATVKGTVVDRNGQPEPGAVVSLFPDDTSELRPDLYRNQRADQKGEFEIHGLVPRTYKVVAFERVEPAALHDPQFLQQFAQQSQTITVARRTTYSISVIPVATPPGQAADDAVPQ